MLLAGCSLGADPAGSTPATTASTGTATPTVAATPDGAPDSQTSSASTTAAPTTVADVFAAVRKSATQANNGRLTGTVTAEDETMRIELEGRTNGTNQRLKLTTSDGTRTIYTVSDKYYLLADKKYWEKNAGETAAEQLAGKYVLLSEEDAASFGAFTIGALVEQLLGSSELSPLESIESPALQVTRDGERLYALTDDAVDTGKVLVTTDGRAQLRSIEVGGAEPAALDFSRWNGVDAISAPPPEDVVTL